MQCSKTNFTHYEYGSKLRPVCFQSIPCVRISIKFLNVLYIAGHALIQPTHHKSEFLNFKNYRKLIVFIPLILFLITDLNILAFYTTACFRFTLSTAFALLYIWLNGSVDILVTALKYIFYYKSPEDGHWSGPKHVV
jgi:hypothetical protein